MSLLDRTLLNSKVKILRSAVVERAADDAIATRQNRNELFAECSKLEPQAPFKCVHGEESNQSR